MPKDVDACTGDACNMPKPMAHDMPNPMARDMLKPMARDVSNPMARDMPSPVPNIYGVHHEESSMHTRTVSLLCWAGNMTDSLQISELQWKPCP